MNLEWVWFSAAGRRAARRGGREEPPVPQLALQDLPQGAPVRVRHRRVRHAAAHAVPGAAQQGPVRRYVPNSIDAVDTIAQILFKMVEFTALHTNIAKLPDPSIMLHPIKCLGKITQYTYIILQVFPTVEYNIFVSTGCWATPIETTLYMRL